MRPRRNKRKRKISNGWRQKVKGVLYVLLFVVFIAPIAYIFLLKYVNPPLTPLMLQRWLQGYAFERNWVTLQRISPALRQTVIAAEDNNFCQHAGFDFAAIKSALIDAIDGKRSRGASTISMQTSKNLLLLPNRSIIRKLFEAYYTIWLELILSKQRILEIYLNIIEFGQGVYGADAGAQYYFKRSAARLTPAQAAQMVTVLPGPLYLSPQQGAQKAKQYQRRVQQLGQLLACAD